MTLGGDVNHAVHTHASRSALMFVSIVCVFAYWASLSCCRTTCNRPRSVLCS